MRAKGWLRRLLKSERGNALIVGAATMPLLIGAGAVGIDTIQYSLWKRQLQRAADSGALAAARALAQQKDVQAAVTRDLQLNNTLPISFTEVTNAPTGGPFAGDRKAVRVILRSQQRLAFWQYFTDESPTVEVAATAAVVIRGRFCMMAMDEGNVAGIQLIGNANLNLGCGIVANAAGNPAIDAGGSSTIVANPIMSVGALDPNNPKFAGSTVIPYTSEQENPFANVTDPSDLTSTMDCSRAWQPGDGPGCYRSMNVNSTVTLASGIYYIKDGDANFGPHANVTGNQVALVFTGTGDSIGKFDMDGQAEVNLTAPTSGPYDGIVMYRDDDRLTMDTLRINGGQTLRLQGAMYFPKTRLWFNGNSDVTSNCLQIVAQQLQFNGGANITNNCSDGYGDPFAATYVRLVE